MCPLLRFPVVLLASALLGQPPVDHTKLAARLGAEADAFERQAYRLAGIETLTQTVPDGVRMRRTMHGGETKLPGYTKEIVSEYGFVSVDAPGGSLKEIRRVLTIDGQRWAKESKSLKALARDMTARDAHSRRKSLEDFESFGLTGFVSDLGQLILLFARGGVARYEMEYEKLDDDGLEVWTYQQLDGTEALTVFGETGEPVREKLHGRIWVQRSPMQLVKISLDSTREYEKTPVHDTSVVQYEKSGFGILLPSRILHQQWVGPTLLVTDEFQYSGFKRVLAGGRE